MKHKHWLYFKYVVRHKYYVYKAGRVTGAPLWRLIIHDWSKFTIAEWFPYVENFYGAEIPKEGSSYDGPWAKLRRSARKQAFRYAFLHHIHHNPHHWEHWVLVEPQPMPQHFVREMVADWCGAGRAISGKWDQAEWYEKNKDRIKLDPLTRKEVEIHLTYANGQLHN